MFEVSEFFELSYKSTYPSISCDRSQFGFHVAVDLFSGWPTLRSSTVPCI